MSHRQSNAARPHARATTRATAIAVAIAATIAIVLVMRVGIVGAEPASSAHSAVASSVPSSSSSLSASDDAIYPGNAAINAFVIAFNEANPDVALGQSDLHPTTRNGSIDENKVVATIAGTRVTIMGSKSSDDLSVSVSWSPSRSGQTGFDGVDYANHQMFSLVMRAMVPSLSDDDIQTRWEEVSASDATASWDDHTTQFSGNAYAVNPDDRDTVRLTKLDRVPIGTVDDD